MLAVQAPTDFFSVHRQAVAPSHHRTHATIVAGELFCESDISIVATPLEHGGSNMKGCDVCQVLKCFWCDSPGGCGCVHSCRIWVPPTFASFSWHKGPPLAPPLIIPVTSRFSNEYLTTHTQEAYADQLWSFCTRRSMGAHSLSTTFLRLGSRPTAARLAAASVRAAAKKVHVFESRAPVLCPDAV